MMVESASWDDWSASNAPPINDDDKWHVALAPGEVKVVSLEQLDDLFRLSIVDAETKVWQDGMSEWQPLRVIAGLDEKPEPKRTHPKPPSPRSSPPPAPQRSVPSPPRPQSRAPAAEASFYPPTVAPTSFYPQTATVAPIRTVAPLAPLGSVRPLVVSHAPRTARRGGGFGRFLIGLAALAGVSITLYRNGIVRDAATSLHQEALYGRLEAALGGPSFGTLRAVEQSTTTAQAAAQIPSGSDDVLTDSPASPAVAKSNATPTAANTSQGAASSPPPPVVSLESLAHEHVGTAAKAETQPASIAPRAPAPSTAPAKFETTTVAKSLPTVAKSAPIAKAAAPSAPAVKPAKPAPVEKPVAEKPESQMTERERLNAAIAHSMMSSPPSSKSAKGKSSEYDPLNPKL
jgi:hypothetical protein